MPADRSRKLIARRSPHPDEATNTTQSEDLTPRPPPVRLATPLPQESSVSSPTSSALQHPTPFLQPDIRTPAASQPGSPAPPSTALTTLRYPEHLNLTPAISSPAILPHTPSPHPPHFRGNGMFHNAQNFIISNSQFVDSSPTGFGLQALLRYSMPDAFYNSSARYPPPKCHLGTRNDYITLITNWALEQSDRKEPVLWMHGPFGIGKSAIAQSCAEALAPINKLAGTLFFSRSNADRDDPRRVITSIAYQIAATCPTFREIIDQRMISDPALAMTSLSTQFENLLVHPLRGVDTAESGLDGRVVIIDGLDECRGTAEQCEIIKIIATSARKRTTPFRWFITSRPEDSISRTMNSAVVSPVHSYIKLPVSRAIDHEILVYLTDELRQVREDYSLPDSWPSEEALTLLVERCAGLWIYVATMVRFIKDENSLGPEDQLQIVIEFAKEVSANVLQDNPLAEMDFFYTLIMQRVSSKLRTIARKILLINHMLMSPPLSIMSMILCLSSQQLRRVCTSIQLVMEVQGPDLESMRIKFYHASFLDFMKDPLRSKELCIMGDFLIGYRRELLGWLHEVCSRSTDSSHIVFPLSTVLPEGVSHTNHYYRALTWFWTLCGVPEHPFDSETAMSLEELSFGKMLGLTGRNNGWPVVASRVRDNLSAELRDGIIRRANCPIPECKRFGSVWILGHGENETIPRRQWDSDGFMLENNQDPPDRWCFCGARRRNLR